MSHIIPSLRTAFHPTYSPPEIRRKPNTPATAGDPAPGTDFNTVLKKQTEPPVDTAVHTLGSINLGTPLPAAAARSEALPPVPTVQSVFGDNPWVFNAGGTGPYGDYGYNTQYFATPETAAKVADMLGGKVETAYAITPFGPFTQNQPNQMVKMPDGRLINAGLIAGLYGHGFSQQTIDQMISVEVNGKLG